MNKRKVVIGAEIWNEHMEIIETYCDVKTLPWTGTDYLPAETEIIKRCSGFEISIFYTEQVTERVIDALAASGLKLMGCGRATPNNIQSEALKKHNIPLFHTPGRNAHSVAEYTVGMMLALCKRIAFTYHGLQSGRFLAEEKDIEDIPEKKDVIWRFKDRENPRSSYPWSIDLYGRTIGLVGLGHIGKNVGDICRGMGMNVLAYDPYQPAELFEKSGIQRFHDPMDMLPLCDFVSVHLNVTPETKDMIDEKWFEAMRPEAYFINTARAAVVKQEALIKSLEEKKIAFAALDVMWDEPAPINHPLLYMDNVLLTPHMGGISTDSKKWASEMIKDEILNYISGKPMNHIWNKS